MSDRESRRLTFQQVAERAGVSRTAVSNWAKRHDDFPVPVSAPGARPVLFDAVAVESWLERSGRRASAINERSVASAATDALKSVAAAGASSVDSAVVLLTVAAAAKSLVETASPRMGEEMPMSCAEVIKRAARVISDSPDFPSLFGEGLNRHVEDPLAADLPALWKRMLELGPAEFGELAESVTTTVAATLGRAHAGLGHATSTSSELVAQLAVAVNPRARVVSDPVCGTGDTLLRVARSLDLRENVFGQEINVAVADLARARLWLHGLHANITAKDALESETVEGSELIVAELPFGQRQPKVSNDAPHRVFANAHGPFASEASFVLDICEGLSPEGVGIALVPTAMLGATSLRDWREWLVSQGLVSRIVELPRGVVDYTAISVCALVLHAAAAGRGARVDLVDLNGLNVRKVGVAGLVEASGLTGVAPAAGTVQSVSFADLGEDVLLQPALRAATSITPEQARAKVQSTGDVLDAELTKLEDFMEDWVVSPTPPLLRARVESAMTVAELIEGGVLRVVRAQATREAEPGDDEALTVLPTGEPGEVAKTGGRTELRKVLAGPGFEPLEAKDVVLPLGGPRPATLVPQTAVDLGMVALGTGARALRVMAPDKLDPAYLGAVLSSPLNRMSATTGGIMRRPFRSLTVAMLPLEDQMTVLEELELLDEASDLLRSVRRAVSKRVDALQTWLSVR